VSTGLVAGKVALVTGGGAGIGRAAAALFAAEGARVAVADRDLDAAAETVARIEADGGTAVAIRADVTEITEVDRMIAQVVTEFGTLDCAYNNAGVEDAMKRLHETAPEEWQHVLGVDLTGTWLCLRAEIRSMLTTGGGSIVNAGSVLASVAMPNVPSYTSAKHGVLGLTRAAALDYARNGIRINAVAGGAIRTDLVQRTIDSGQVTESAYADLHPMARLGEPREVAEAVVWLCSDRASFVTGHSLSVDGGFLIR
jgi:NAD(P)-dependent dehydrogenase (short-subunit alcohol dehydrogenase family)